MESVGEGTMPLSKAEETMRIALLGDSLTAGMPGSAYFEVLRGRLAGDTLVNLGRGNDTVISLYHRVAGMQLDAPFDVALLWIGVNDVLGRAWWPYDRFHSLLGQRRARDIDEFQACYRSLLEVLCRNAERVIAVSPSIRGEDLGNRWNRQIRLLSRVIENLVLHNERAEFLDLWTLFAQELAGKPVSDYVPRSAVRVILDAVLLRSEEEIDAKARQRGLHLTLDGLHLNSAGAELVAEAFAHAIAG
jgi:lysophospholipase L1-like esterase